MRENRNQPAAVKAAELLLSVPDLGALLRRLPAAQTPLFMKNVEDVALMPTRTVAQREWQAMVAETVAVTWGAFLDEPAQGRALARAFADVAERAVA